MNYELLNTVGIQDSRISNISDTIDYGVVSGAASNNYQAFSSNTNSSSSINFQVTVPNQSIVVDREVLINTKVNLELRVTGLTSGSNAFPYGNSIAFNSFPLNSIFSTSSCSINNCSISVNTKDVKEQIVNMMSLRGLQKYQGMTPIMCDKYKNYSDSVLKPNSPLNGFNGAGYDDFLLPRGCHPITISSVSHAITAGGVDNSLISTNVADTWLIKFQAEFTEPILGLSPFLYGERSNYNNGGLVGVDAFNMTFNIDNTLNRMFSNGTTSGTFTFSLDPSNPFANTKLLLNFLTTQPTSLIPSLNLCPLLNMQTYVTGASNTSAVSALGSAVFTINAIQMNQIPDKIIIVVRKPINNQTNTDSSTFFKIDKVIVDFNNTSGLLSNATPQSLWQMSTRNGSQQSWSEFNGFAGVSNNSTSTTTSTSQFVVQTAGSIIVIDPAMDLSLESYLSNGSIGQYSLQIQLTCTNNSNVSITPEVCVIACNSGVFQTI